jgi:hypothetical protein
MKDSFDRNDAVSGDPSEDGQRGSPSRRELLATIGSVAGAGALAGCPGDVTSQEFEATPVVLTEPGSDRFGFEEFSLEKDTQTREIAEVGEATITSYFARHSRLTDGEPPMRFGTNAPGFSSVMALSTPSPAAIGSQVNPLASEPLGELIKGERGRQLIHRSGLFDVPDFDWRRGPTEVGRTEIELLGEATEARSFMGVAVGGDDPASTFLMNVARIVTEGDAVLVGEFTRRRTPPDPIEVDSPCVDGLCQMLDPMQVDMWRRYKRIGEYMATCSEITVGGQSIEVCGGSGGSESDPEALPKFGIKNARLVQQVENTEVKAPGNAAIHTESNPDLVEGENTAVVFDFDTIENVDELDGPLEIDITHGAYGSSNRPKKTFELSKQDLHDINNGEHTTSVFHRNANDSDADNDNPVFELSSNPSIVVTTSTLVRFDFWERVNPSQSEVDIDPLTVGFIRLEDENGGSRYGNSNGQPRNFRRSFESASEYLRRSYPGDVVAYGHESHAIVGTSEVSGLFKQNCDDSCVVLRDMKRGRRQLNRMATDTSYPSQGAGFPNGGILHTDGLNRSNMESKIRNEGFDVVVVIVPEDDPSNSGATDYYDHHDISASGLAFGDPAAAVSSLGATASGSDVGISTTVAQEIGHYFQQDYMDPSGNPMAQRRNDSDDNNQPMVNGKPLDPAHARNQTSNRVSGGDNPGVISTGYDLEDSFANIQQYGNPNGSFSATGPSKGANDIDRVPSYMSYTPNDWKAWTDARIHQQLIDSGWVAPGTSGGGSSQYMLSAAGGVTEEGTVRYDEVTSMSGSSRYTDLDDGPVVVELLGPDGEVLVDARVPATVRGSHHGPDFVGPAVEAPSFTLPFEQRGVAVRTRYEDSETMMNPVERSIRDTVGRVPDEGFEGEPQAARDSIGEALDEVAVAMKERDYGEAADVLDERVRDRIRERISYESTLLGVPSSEDLERLVDEMVGRLRSLAEERM